ncbi:MAG: hypothetical protein K8R28_04960 [Desulfobacterales bacterium]|nr:hypothetical protein [Desulfobacterales bacterium]
MRFFSLFVLFGAILSGCAVNSANRLSVDQSMDMKREKVAINYFLAEKKINYIETLYRVLWLETKSSSMDFSGIWNPDDLLSDVVSSSIGKLDFDTSTLVSILDHDVVNDYRKALKIDYIKNSIGENPQIPGVKLAPPNEYFKKYPDFDAFNTLSEALLDKGYSYLFEYLASDIYGNAPGYGMVIVTMPSQLRILDLKQKKVIWSNITTTHEIYQMGGDLQKLEHNNLEKLKEAILIGVNEVVAQDRLSPMLLNKVSDNSTN